MSAAFEPLGPREPRLAIGAPAARACVSERSPSALRVANEAAAGALPNAALLSVTTPTAPDARRPDILDLKLSRAVAKRSVLQRFPYIGHNTETAQLFRITRVERDGKWRIEAATRDGTQDGHLRYSWTADSLVIEHIETSPEQGTGLGPIFIMLAALTAANARVAKISVVGLRYPEYYERWGFDIQTPREAVRHRYIAAGREEDIPASIGVPQADSTPAMVASRTLAFVKARWSLQDHQVWERAAEWETRGEELWASREGKRTLTEFPRYE